MPAPSSTSYESPFHPIDLQTLDQFHSSFIFNAFNPCQNATSQQNRHGGVAGNEWSAKCKYSSVWRPPSGKAISPSGSSPCPSVSSLRHAPNESRFIRFTAFATPESASSSTVPPASAPLSAPR